MKTDQADQREREYHDVQGKETAECLRADRGGTTHEFNQVAADNRHGSGSIGRDRRCPEGELTPGEKVTGETEDQTEIKQAETGEPGQLTRTFIRPHKRTESMCKSSTTIIKLEQTACRLRINQPYGTTLTIRSTLANAFSTSGT